MIRDPQAPVRRVLDVTGLLDVLEVEPPGGDDVRDLPRHLMVWLTGDDDDADPPVSLDDELHPGFSLPDWLAGVHDGYPDAVTAVVHDGTRRTGEEVAAIVRGRSANRFRGDTTPTSLAELRQWVAMAAADLGDHAGADTELVERIVLVASELAANVERHAPGWVLVDLAAYDGGTLVAVTDSRPVILPPAERSEVAPGWRGGLDVVRAVSDAFGMLTGPSTKTVWAVLRPGTATT